SSRRHRLGGGRGSAKKPVMRWVADTGPVLHLAEAKALHLLALLGEVVIPPAVEEELSRRQSLLGLPAALRVVPLEAPHRTEAMDWCSAGLVDRGEAQAIALTRQLAADVFLTDDAAARLLATTLGLQARGSLGIVLWLAGQRRIGPAEASQHLENLFRSSLWVSPRIREEARAALKKSPPSHVTWRHASGDIRLRAPLQMLPHLLGHLGIEFFFAEE
ncbi:MAG: hypothetical protein ABIO94_08195, partial [Opitutaceae bacterium]